MDVAEVILVDTSLWVDHFRRRNSPLVELLASAQVLAHPFVIGELALGHLEPRGVILDDLQNLPQSIIASHQEVLHFINEHQLFGRGIGYVDAHLLASTQLTAGATLWTRDNRLRATANRLALAANLPA